MTQQQLKTLEAITAQLQALRAELTAEQPEQPPQNPELRPGDELEIGASYEITKLGADDYPNLQVGDVVVYGAGPRAVARYLTAGRFLDSSGKQCWYATGCGREGLGTWVAGVRKVADAPVAASGAE